MRFWHVSVYVADELVTRCLGFIGCSCMRAWRHVCRLAHVLLATALVSVHCLSRQTRTPTMVEGHQCARVIAWHRKKLVGKVFQATSPNGRCAEGATRISGCKLARAEHIGKVCYGSMFRLCGM